MLTIPDGDKLLCYRTLQGLKGSVCCRDCTNIDIFRAEALDVTKCYNLEDMRWEDM